MEWVELSIVFGVEHVCTWIRISNVYVFKREVHMLGMTVALRRELNLPV